MVFFLLDLNEAYLLKWICFNDFFFLFTQMEILSKYFLVLSLHFLTQFCIIFQIFDEVYVLVKVDNLFFFFYFILFYFVVFQRC